MHAGSILWSSTLTHLLFLHSSRIPVTDLASSSDEKKGGFHENPEGRESRLLYFTEAMVVVGIYVYHERAPRGFAYVYGSELVRKV